MGKVIFSGGDYHIEVNGVTQYTVEYISWTDDLHSIEVEMCLGNPTQAEYLFFRNGTTFDLRMYAIHRSGVTSEGWLKGLRLRSIDNKIAMQDLGNSVLFKFSAKEYIPWKQDGE